MAKIMIFFGGQQMGEYELDQPAIIIGRDPSCHITIDNLGISRQHCQFIKRGDIYLVQDMNSANGTFVNQKKVGEHFLNSGDKIEIGKYTIEFSNVQQPEAQKRTKGVAEAMSANEEPDGLGDGMHTYVMDGEMIQAKIAAMKAAQQKGAAPMSAADYGKAMSPGGGGTAGGFGAAMSAAMEADQLATAKKVQLMLLVWALIATILALVFGYKMFDYKKLCEETAKKPPTAIEKSGDMVSGGEDEINQPAEGNNGEVPE